LKRLLFLSPVFDASHVGGLSLALSNLKQELEARGWRVESPGSDLRSAVPAPAILTRVQRNPWLVRMRERVPEGLRRTISALFWSKATREDAAKYLRWAEEQLAEPSVFDAVLVCIDGNIPGVAALAASRDPRTVVLSLQSLAGELEPWFWSIARLRKVHRWFFRPVSEKDIGCAVFASDGWRVDAIRAGLSPNAAHTIYFGIPIPDRMPDRLTPPGHRLLWVGRLAPEKGLHLLLEALPAVRDRFPDVSLTAIAAQGDGPYRQLIEARIESLGLHSAVKICPPVRREKLAEFYATHDLLYFYSIFREPVALVLMEAFAHRIPVIANRAECSDLVQDNVTCRTYDTGSAQSIAAAISATWASSESRGKYLVGARQLVEKSYSSAAMGDAYDRLLSAPRS